MLNKIKLTQSDIADLKVQDHPGRNRLKTAEIWHIGEPRFVRIEQIVNRGFFIMATTLCDIYYSQHLGWKDRTNTWGEHQKKILTIRGLEVIRFFAGDEGTLFFVTADGHLYYHKHAGWSNGELANGKLTRIDIGWADYQAVSAGNAGYIYVTQPNGDLLLYHQSDLNSFISKDTFWDIRAYRIGSQWNNFEHVFSGNEGYIFGVNDGYEGGHTGDHVFYLYKRKNWQSNSNDYSIQRRGIGVNWNFGKLIFAGVNEVIYAITSGVLLEYKHGEDGFYTVDGKEVGTNFGSENTLRFDVSASRSKAHPQSFCSIYTSKVNHDNGTPVDNRNKDEISIVNGLTGH